MMIATKAMIALAGLCVLGGNTQDHDSNWARQVSGKLDRAVAFDRDAMPRHLYGVTGLAFRVGDDGRATAIRLVHSSGNAWLDGRAAGKLRMIGRLPDAPEGVRSRTILAMIEQGRPNQFGRVAVEAARGHAADALRAEAGRIARVDGGSVAIVNAS